MTLDEIFNRCVIREDGCIAWEGAHDGRGYAHFATNGRTYRTFRVLYELLVGPIRKELLHHTCENKWCVNPFHGEDITKTDHHKYKHPKPLRTHCAKGHELTPENTYVRQVKNRPNAIQRKCRICERERKSTPEYLAYMRASYYRRKKRDTAA